MGAVAVTGAGCGRGGTFCEGTEYGAGGSFAAGTGGTLESGRANGETVAEEAAIGADVEEAFTVTGVAEAEAAVEAAAGEVAEGEVAEGEPTEGEPTESGPTEEVV